MHSPNRIPNNNFVDIKELHQRKENIIGVLESKWDYYLDNPPMKPKEEIANYIESQGFSVPKRFSWLSDALWSWKPIIIRSEHPVEYYGAAWIHESYKVIDPTEVYINKRWRWLETPVNIKHYTQQWLEYELIKLEQEFPRYAKLAIIPLEEYYWLLSYSYRELVPWYNCSIVADSAILWRYHIFTTWTSEYQTWYHNYLIVDNGTIVVNWADKATEDIVWSITNSIDMYEKIRHLPKFNPNHCPILEFQRLEDKIYFLQYHRTRDEDFADFELDLKEFWNKVTAWFVRWKTSKEGNIYTISAEPSNEAIWLPSIKFDWAIIQWYSVAVHEYLSRKHKIISDLNELSMMLSKTKTCICQNPKCSIVICLLIFEIVVV